MLRLLNVYPPLAGAGIRVRRTAAGGFESRLKLRLWNNNFVGTHFGGSLYTMCDPFFMLLLIERLGPEYLVWDKAATIRFKKPGRGTVLAVFEIPEERLAEIRAAADRDGKVEPRFTVEVKDEAGDVVAEVEKLLWVRRRDATPRPPY